MDLQNLTGKMLTDSIRQKAQVLLVIFLPLTVLALLAGILLVIRLRIAGAVIGTVLIAIPLRFLLQALPQWLHPERADVFLKYGDPESVAARIRSSSEDIFFQNGRLIVTDQFLLDTERPDMLLFFPHALTVYPDGVQGKEEYLVVYDSWGQKLRFPFTNGRQQVFKIDMLTDKIRRHAPGCRCGHRPEDLDYVRQQKRPLPESKDT